MSNKNFARYDTRLNFFRILYRLKLWTNPYLVRILVTLMNPTTAKDLLQIEVLWANNSTTHQFLKVLYKLDLYLPANVSFWGSLYIPNYWRK